MQSMYTQNTYIYPLVQHENKTKIYTEISMGYSKKKKSKDPIKIETTFNHTSSTQGNENKNKDTIILFIVLVKLSNANNIKR